MVNRFLTALLLPLIGAFLLSCGERNSPAGPNAIDLQLAAIWDSPGYATDIAIVNGYAYLADDQAGFHVLNVTDPADPVYLSTHGAMFDQVIILSADAALNMLTIVDDNNQRYFYNITDPDSVTPYDGTDSNTRTNDVLVIGGTPASPASDSLMMLFTGDSNDGLTFTLYERFSFGDVISWAGAANSETQTYGRTLGLANDGYLILTAQDQMGVVLYDYGEYNNPVERGRLDTPGSARHIATQDSIAYIADGRSGLQIVSYRHPDSLRHLGSLEVPGYANDLAVQDDVVYIAAGDGGTVAVDVSDPSNPELIGRHSSTYTNAVVTSPEAVFVADRDEGLLIFTLRNK